MEDHKPIKRHPAIVELSKDHHFALLLVWKIRNGLNKSIDSERISRYVVHFFDTDLIQHFKEEEDFLFTKLDKNNELRLQAEEEHRLIKKSVNDLRLNPGKELLENFAAMLESHIRFEERKLFNHFQEIMSEDELTQLASSLKPRNHEKEPAWEDQFWTN
jgi:Hemerythrin HHE cation binding domain